MSTIAVLYAGSTATTITATLASLTNGSARQTLAVDNTTTKYLEALLRVTLQGATSAAVGVVSVYAYGAAESSSPVYTDGASGLDATFTAANRLNANLVMEVTMNGANSVTSGPMSVAQAFGGTLPQKWGLIFVNGSGADLDSTAAHQAVVFQGTGNSVA